MSAGTTPEKSRHPDRVTAFFPAGFHVSRLFFQEEHAQGVGAAVGGNGTARAGDKHLVELRVGS